MDMLKTTLYTILILNCYLLIGQETGLKIEDVLSVDFQPERLESIRSLKNGDQYTTLSVSYEEKKSIIYQHYYSGKKRKAILVENDSNKGIPFFTDYTFSKNETKLLLETEMNPIYRRSKQAIYWVYDIENKAIEKLFPHKIPS